MADNDEPLSQNVELHENLAPEASWSKRKRPVVDEVFGVGGVEGRGESVSGAETSLESGRLKRRNGGGTGAGAMEGMGGKVVGGVGGGVSLVEGAQTRKRKSIEKLAAVVGIATIQPEDDVGSVSPSREALKNSSGSSKKRKPGAGLGDEAAFGMDVPEPSDEGRVSQGLRLRFTRSGNSLAAKKVVPFAEEDTRTGEAVENTEGAGLRSRGTFEAVNRIGEEAWTMPSQAKDQIHPSTGDVHGTVPDSNFVKVPEKSPLIRELYRIPSHAGWFSWGKIHNLERRSLREFFDGKSLSKTPKIYKEYRDFIINKYREKEQRPLTFTEVRRMLIGDVNALRRVFDFLDHWGLINYQAGNEANQEPSPTPTVDDGVPSGVRVALGPVVSPVPAANLYLQQSESSLGAPGSLPGLPLQTLPSYRNAFAPVSSVGEVEKIVRNSNCCSCGGDCAKLRFHCEDEILQAGLDLCPACFKAGKYGPGRVAKDFVRVDVESDSAVDKWTTKETLGLLEAIGRFGDNWNQVADHVGTKSRAECVKQFIRLPFGDRFLCDAGAEPPVSEDGDSISRMLVDGVVEARISDNVHEAEETMKANGENHSGSADRDVPVAVKCERRSTKKELSPFQDVNNPLLSQVALMSAMVGPRAAAAAAQAAISTIADEEPALANHPIMNGFSTLPGSQQNSDSRSKESSRSETKEQGLSAQPGEREADGGPSAVQLQVGIATSLAAAAVNARLLADQEEREMEVLVTDMIENKLKALYAKVEHFEELEMLLEKERIQVEQARQALFVHQFQFAESRLHMSRHG